AVQNRAELPIRPDVRDFIRHVLRGDLPALPGFVPDSVCNGRQGPALDQVFAQKPTPSASGTCTATHAPSRTRRNAPSSAADTAGTPSPGSPFGPASPCMPCSPCGPLILTGSGFGSPPSLDQDSVP